jgi:hypothetical protein
MKAEEKKTLTVTVEGGDVATFKSVIRKCAEEAGRVGFAKGFDAGEAKLIKALGEALGDGAPICEGNT